MSEYWLTYTKSFKSQILYLIAQNPGLRIKIGIVLETLLENPFSDDLFTHKFNTELIDDLVFKPVYSTRITKNINLFWQPDEGNKILLLSIN